MNDTVTESAPLDQMAQKFEKKAEEHKSLLEETQKQDIAFEKSEVFRFMGISQCLKESKGSRTGCIGAGPIEDDDDMESLAEHPFFNVNRSAVMKFFVVSRNITHDSDNDDTEAPESKKKRISPGSAPYSSMYVHNDGKSQFMIQFFSHDGFRLFSAPNLPPNAVYDIVAAFTDIHRYDYVVQCHL